MLHLILEVEEGGVPWYVILCVLVALVAGGLLFWYNQKGQSEEPKLGNTPSRVEPTSTIRSSMDGPYVSRASARPDEFPATSAAIPQGNRSQQAAIAARQQIKEHVASGLKMTAEAAATPEPLRLSQTPSLSATATDFLHEAEVQRTAGRADLATKKVRDLLMREPRNAAAYEMLGDLLFEAADYVGSADAFRESAHINPSSGRVCMSLAKSLEKLSDMSGAIAAYRAATVADPTEHRAFNNLGGLLAETGDIAGGVEAFRKALELNPGDETAKENLELAQGLLNENAASV